LMNLLGHESMSTSQRYVQPVRRIGKPRRRTPSTQSWRTTEPIRIRPSDLDRWCVEGPDIVKLVFDLVQYVQVNVRRFPPLCCPVNVRSCDQATITPGAVQFGNE
jgi:hypothetical protein